MKHPTNNDPVQQPSLLGRIRVASTLAELEALEYEGNHYTQASNKWHRRFAKAFVAKRNELNNIAS